MKDPLSRSLIEGSVHRIKREISLLEKVLEKELELEKEAKRKKKREQPK